MNRHTKMTAVAKINPYKSVDEIVYEASTMDESINLLGVDRKSVV